MGMMGDQKNRLIEMFHLSTHNKCLGFNCRYFLIDRIFTWSEQYFKMFIVTDVILECFFPC